jgi:hypothetical protein
VPPAPLLLKLDDEPVAARGRPARWGGERRRLGDGALGDVVAVVLRRAFDT